MRQLAHRTASRRLAWIAVLTMGSAFAAIPATALGQSPAPAASGSAAASASATPPAPNTPASLADTLTGDAKERYEAGRLLHRNGDYAGAKLKFQEAYDLAKDPRLLWNVGACEKELHHYASVQLLLEKYLAEGGLLLAPEDRQDAQRLLDAIQQFIATIHLTVSEPGARVLVDGVQAGTTPMRTPLRVDQGARELRVVKEGFDDWVQAGSVSGGADLTINVTLKKAVRQGTLQILAGPHDTIAVDGKAIAVGQWQGTLVPGPHRVQVSNRGMQPYDTQAVVELNQKSTLRVKLSSVPAGPVQIKGGDSTWLWVTSGVALAVGIGVGGYLLLKPHDEAAPPPIVGTMYPGTVPLIHFR